MLTNSLLFEIDNYTINVTKRILCSIEKFDRSGRQRAQALPFTNGSDADRLDVCAHNSWAQQFSILVVLVWVLGSVANTVNTRLHANHSLVYRAKSFAALFAKTLKTSQDFLVCLQSIGFWLDRNQRHDNYFYWTYLWCYVKNVDLKC